MYSIRSDAMDNPVSVTFLGVGGSCSVANPERVKYGTNTSCVWVQAGGKNVLFDMGTGLARLKDITHADILLSHFHYDHIMGMPFFVPMYGEGVFHVYAVPPGGETVRTWFDRFLSPPFLPMGFNAFKAAVCCHNILRNQFETDGGFRVSTTPLDHPGGATGYALQCADKKIIYLCDNDRLDTTITRFCGDADLVIYDSFFLTEEYENGLNNDWGHSHHEAGLQLAMEAGVKRIAFTHHAAARTDQVLDELADKCAARFPGAIMAADNLTITL
jgi:phosphoribosyl 1,2-cyclic phosphodiesterase